jgi:integrase/recombinase XerD
MRKDCWMRGDGPLVPFGGLFRAELAEAGHPPGSEKHYLLLMSRLNRWLEAEGLEMQDLSVVTAQQFLDATRAAGQRRVPTMVSLVPLFDCLRRQGVMPPEQPVDLTARERFLAEYHHHLVHDRGLAPTTVRRYMNFARRFLADRASRTGSETGAEGLTSSEVNAYMLDFSTRLIVESAKREAADLRALLRYLYLAGRLEADLGTAMPPVAVWRGQSLPRTMRPAEVDALIASCDRSSRSGRRDRAVLMLMARLGLRAGEVAAMQLEDVDWRAGEITVRGKARRKDRLPLPSEVGEAIVEYLTDGRPSCTDRHLILTLYAPFRPIHPSSITNIVYRACARSGLTRVGGHRLRHALATEMLRQGGDLLEIAQVLRQSDLSTTAGYAKVDRAALRRVSRPWPGVRS